MAKPPIPTLNPPRGIQPKPKLVKPDTAFREDSIMGQALTTYRSDSIMGHALLHTKPTETLKKNKVVQCPCGEIQTTTAKTKLVCIRCGKTTTFRSKHTWHVKLLKHTDNPWEAMDECKKAKLKIEIKHDRSIR